MAGHSKWKKIKREKEMKDKQRGNIFSKLSRLITLAVIEGKGITEPENNLKLRLAIEKAKKFNMPKENIQRAIEQGKGPAKDQLKEVLYEVFAPYGIAMIIQAATDNPNRTLSEIRNVLDKYGGKLAGSGAVSYLFKKCGLIIFDKETVSEDKIFETAEKVGAFDIEENEKFFRIYFPFENLGKVEEGEINYKPTSLIKIENEEKTETIINLIEALEQLDDIQKVFTNWQP